MIIVTLTKNSSKTINDTIFSIENQSLKNIKWIILDDNSTDDTLDKIYKSYIKKEIIKISSSGLFHAYNISYNFLFNKNFDDIIFFLHSDDIIYDKFVLEKIEFQFNKHKLDSLFGNIVYFKDDQFKYFRNWNNSEMNSKTIEDNLFLIKKFKKRDLFTGWTFPHTSFFFHSRILHLLPSYDENYEFCADYGWILDVMLQNKFNIYYYNLNIIKMRYGGKSTKFINLINNTYLDFLILRKRFSKSFNFFFIIVVILFLKKIRKIVQLF